MQRRPRRQDAAAFLAIAVVPGREQRRPASFEHDGAAVEARDGRRVPRARVDERARHRVVLAVGDRRQLGARGAAPRSGSVPAASRPGPRISSASPRRALRSWPIAAAARSPRPTTSPIDTPRRPSGSSITSYQSPPTSRYSRPGRVPGRDLRTVPGGDRLVRQQAVLEDPRDLPFTLGHAGSLGRLRRLRRDRGEEVELLEVERLRPLEADEQRADRGAAHDHRELRDGFAEIGGERRIAVADGVDVAEQRRASALRSRRVPGCGVVGTDRLEHRGADTRGPPRRPRASRRPRRAGSRRPRAPRARRARST